MIYGQNGVKYCKNRDIVLITSYILFFTQIYSRNSRKIKKRNKNGMLQEKIYSREAFF